MTFGQETATRSQKQDEDEMILVYGSEIVQCGPVSQQQRDVGDVSGGARAVQQVGVGGNGGGIDVV